jgi:hypothetical protein
LESVQDTLEAVKALTSFSLSAAENNKTSDSLPIENNKPIDSPGGVVGCVLVVAEKPSVARGIAAALGHLGHGRGHDLGVESKGRSAGG